VAALTIWSSAAAAVTVGVVRPPHPSALATETLFRVSGELRSLGLDTRMLNLSDAEASVMDSGELRLDRLASAQGTDAIIAVVGTPVPTAIQVWATDGKGRAIDRRLPLDPTAEQAPRTIAIRGIELLRSTLVELDLAPAVVQNRTVDRTALPQSPARGGEPPEQPALQPRFALGAGGYAIAGFDGVGLFVRPLLRFGWLFRPSWLLQGEASGFGTRSTVESVAGSARVRQDQAVLGLGYRPVAGGRLSPLFGLAAGALYTAVDGQAVAPLESQRARRWSVLVDGSAGAGLRLGPRLELTATVHLQAATPYPAVRFVGETVATAARPNVLVALAAEVWL